MNPICILMTCTECGADVWATRDRDPHSSLLCDPCFFDRFGDMLTPDELRRAKLDGDRAQTRDKWLAEYEAAGIADDQDPSLIVLEVTPSTVESPDELEAAVMEARQVRFSTPGDF